MRLARSQEIPLLPTTNISWPTIRSKNISVKRSPCTCIQEWSVLPINLLSKYQDPVIFDYVLQEINQRIYTQTFCPHVHKTIVRASYLVSLLMMSIGIIMHRILIKIQIKPVITEKQWSFVSRIIWVLLKWVWSERFSIVISYTARRIWTKSF